MHCDGDSIGCFVIARRNAELAAIRHAVCGVVGKIQDDLCNFVLVNASVRNIVVEVHLDVHAFHFEVVFHERKNFPDGRCVMDSHRTKIETKRFGYKGQSRRESAGIAPRQALGILVARKQFV